MTNRPSGPDAYLSAWRAMIIAWQRTFIRRWTVAEIDGWRTRIRASATAARACLLVLDAADSNRKQKSETQ